MENSLTESQEIHIYRNNEKNNNDRLEEDHEKEINQNIISNKENKDEITKNSNNSDEKINNQQSINKDNSIPLKNNSTLQERLKQIFQSRINKMENLGKKEIPEELKYNSDESYSSEDINIKSCHRNKEQEEKIRNRLNKKKENEEEKEVEININDNIEMNDNEYEKNEFNNNEEKKEIN